jgi:exopolyphosphatase/guanosine-5'-triphosphate,3'-diphosphate pyrophosphatase
MRTKPTRFAAIDIGTVTCRLLVADVLPKGLSELAREAHIVNLGLGVDETGVLHPDSIARVAERIAAFRAIIDSLQVPGEPEIPVIAIATSAARDAANADELAAALRKSRVELSVIPGEREAALSFKGASGAFLGEQLMVADVGGGSTEIIFGEGGGAPTFRHSFDIGCRRVTERFLRSDPPTAAELAQADEWIRGIMAPVFAQEREGGNIPQRIVAVAGTATSMVSIDREMVVYDSARVDGTEVSRATLEAIHERLCSLPLAQRRQVVGLQPDRAPVMPAGTLILRALLDLAGKEAFTVSESDILQGIILEAAAR